MELCLSCIVKVYKRYPNEKTIEKLAWNYNLSVEEVKDILREAKIYE